MPSYQASAHNRKVPQASPGLSVFLLGSFNRLVSTTAANITNVALTGNVATLTVTVFSGNLPVVGQLVSVSGCSNSVFNVTDAAITAVSFVNTPEDGIGTISYALTHADVVSAPATGRAVAPQIQTGETIANVNSLQCALQSNTGPNNGRDIRVDVTVSSGVTAVAIDAYTAEVDTDSDYQLLGNILTTVGSTPQTGSTIFTDIVANFIRLQISGLAGTGTVIGKVTV